MINNSQFSSISFSCLQKIIELFFKGNIQVIFIGVACDAPSRLIWFTTVLCGDFSLCFTLSLAGVFSVCSWEITTALDEKSSDSEVVGIFSYRPLETSHRDDIWRLSKYNLFKTMGASSSSSQFRILPTALQDAGKTNSFLNTSQKIRVCLDGYATQ